MTKKNSPRLWLLATVFLGIASMGVAVHAAGWLGALCALLTVAASVTAGFYLKSAREAGLRKTREVEDSLQDAEAKFLAFMDHSPFMAWMRDHKGNFVYCNERTAKFMGMTQAQILGSAKRPAWYDQELIERSRRDDLRVLELNRLNEKIEHVPQRDGTIRHWLVLKFPIRSHTGETVVGGVSLDLTGRYEADEKLRLSESRLRSVLQSAGEGIASADAEGKVVSWNRAAEKIFGYTESEMLGQSFEKVLTEAGLPQYRAFVSSISDHSVMVMPGRRKGGEVFDLEFSRSRWRTGAQVQITAILRDVTERKKIEAQLRQSEAHMRMTLDTALDAVPQIVWTARADGQLSYFNRKWFDYVGVSFPLMNPHGWLAWVHPEEVAATTAAWHDALARGVSCEIEYRLRRGADGAYRWHLGHALPVKDANGQVVQWFGTSTDIHDHKLVLEEQAQLRAREATAIETSRLKSEFLAHMSHEIRTPINGVMGMANLLWDTPLAAEQYSYVDAIHRSAQALLGVINDILDFSKIEAGKLEIERVDFDLARVIENIEKVQIHPARAKHLRFECEIEGGVPHLLGGDPNRLGQILGNLVSNAIKFTAQGEVRLRVERFLTGATRSDGRSPLRFSVTDTGIGISASSRERLFQPFTQADSSTNRRYGGTGLGLSICKRIVEQMGGEIGIESVEGRGSTFWFVIPFDLASGVQPASSAQDRNVVPLPFVISEGQGGPRILVAEDNAINQRIILKQLEKLGLRAHAVWNGNEALAALAKSPYDLILMDCQMPELDGYAATARIRASIGAPYRSIPIVAVTANAIKGDREKCLALGMNDYLAKPLHPSELSRILIKWLKKADERKTPAMSDSPLNISGNLKKVDSRPVIDLGMIEELRMLDDGAGEVLHQLIDMFVQGAPGRISAMARAIMAGDLKALNSEAHSLKSSSANLGANRMSDICKQLEHASTPDAAAAVRSLPADLQAEFELVRQALSGIKAGTQAG